jgi:hypothetical protein
MSTPNRFSGYTARLYSGSMGGTETDLIQLGGVALDAAQELAEIYPSGAIDRAAVVLNSGPASVRFATPDLATAFGVVDPAVGLLCTGGAVLQFQKRADGGVFAGSGANVLATSSSGFLLPTRLSASQDKPALLELAYHAFSSTGLAEPFTLTASQSLGGTAPAFSSLFYLGGVYLGSAQILSCCDVRIDFGITFSKFTTRGATDGNLYPKAGAIIKRQPVITLSFTDVSLTPTALSSLFANALGSSLYVYFAQGAAGGQRKSYSGNNHVKITTTSGEWHARSVAVQGESDADTSIEIRPTAALAVAAQTTIP